MICWFHNRFVKVVSLNGGILKVGVKLWFIGGLWNYGFHILLQTCNCFPLSVNLEYDDNYCVAKLLFKVKFMKKSLNISGNCSTIELVK